MKPALAPEFVRTFEVCPPDLREAHPLVLDLDGTLLRTDLLMETALIYLKRRPWGIILLLFWMVRGISHLKYQLAVRTEIAGNLLPVNEQVLTYAEKAAESGRLVVAATAANEYLAAKLCSRFAFISEVIASTETVNLRGLRKAQALQARFPGGFAYAGNSSTDLAVWREASFGLFAGRDPRLLKRMSQVTHIEAELPDSAPGIRQWLKALRIHQWAKNGLVFLPFLLAGKLLDIHAWSVCAAVFIAMALTASATYILNDLFDLEADRQHWSKCKRPIAAGEITISSAVISSVVLLSGGMTLAAIVGGPPVLGALLLYCVVTVAYSFYLKRVPVLDVLVLGSLFTLRLVLGAVAAQVALSAWLTVFSMFFFTSLALAKRATELGRQSVMTQTAGTLSGAATLGRGYVAADALLVSTLGIATTVAAVQVLVVYLFEDAFGDASYTAPELLWATPVLIGLWLGRIWLLSGRGLLNDDPVVFAVTDRTSLMIAGGIVASFAAAALG